MPFSSHQLGIRREALLAKQNVLLHSRSPMAKETKNVTTAGEKFAYVLGLYLVHSVPNGAKYSVQQKKKKEKKTLYQ